jgi:hypothetical protein
VAGAVWNIAYDLGMAAGAFGAGLVVAPIGYSWTFVLAALAMLPVLRLLAPDPGIVDPQQPPPADDRRPDLDRDQERRRWGSSRLRRPARR